MTERQPRGAGKAERRSRTPVLPIAPDAQRIVTRDKLEHATNGATSKSYAITPIKDIGVSDATWEEYLRVRREKGFDEQQRQISSAWLHKRFNA